MVRAGWVVGLLVLVVLAGLARAADEDPSVLLSRARATEHEERNYERALEMYGGILAIADLEPQIRGDALLGQARCHRALEQKDEALAILERIIADESLPVGAHDQAKEIRLKIVADRPEIDQAAIQAEEERRRAERQRARSSELSAEARRARDEGRLEDASELCKQALDLDPDNQEAAALAKQLIEATPDKIALLHQLLHFTNSTRMRAYVRLKAQVKELRRGGRESFQAEDYANADAMFRRAVGLIDDSEFFADLGDERRGLLLWIRQAHEKASAAGVDLGPEPPLPDAGSVRPSFQRRFFDLVSEIFTAHPDEEDPLVLYDAGLGLVPPGAIEQGLAAGNFPSGVGVARHPGTLGRALWMERWIRENVGTGWTTPSNEPPGSGKPRLLDRFGDMLIVQSSRGVHAKVQRLLDGFADVPPPVAVDVALLATTTEGVTRVAATLGTRTSMRESGENLIVPNRLLENCLPLIQHLEGVTLLGTARLTLGGNPTATLAFTQPSENHPSFQGLGAPPMTLTSEQSRFGVWLEIYAENLPDAAGSLRAAVGINASTRVPRGTIVVPKPGVEDDWTRLPRPFAEQGQSAFRQVPLEGTLLLLGLSNPFPGGNVTHPGLAVLVGVRPAATSGATPAVPDTSPGPLVQNGNGGTEEREHDLGPLAVEASDQILAHSWPRRPVSLPLPAAALRKARESWLARSLGRTWTRLAPPEAENPVIVRGRIATARARPEQHAAIQRAVEAFRAHEKTLYQIDVISAEVSEASLGEWLRAANAQPFTQGTYLLTTPQAIQALDAPLRQSGAQTGGLFAVQSRLLARATQKVMATNLHTLSIVEDVGIWLHTDGTQRQIPEIGTAEEGLVVLIRPELDVEGRRLVSAEVQAARLRALEPVLLGHVHLETAKISVPRHLPVQQRQAATPLGDDEALLLSVPHPEAQGMVVAVLLRVTRLQ